MDPVDLIIIGAGTSGIPAAITAADRGARVVLLEKRDVAGGMLFVSGGQFSGAGTRLQRARGIEDTPEQHADDVMRIAHGKANRPLVDVSVRQQGPMVDWLTDLDFEFKPGVPITPFGHETYRLPRTTRGSNGAGRCCASSRKSLRNALRQERLTCDSILASPG